MNNQPTKRRNPFDIPKKTDFEEEAVMKPTVTPTETKITPYQEESNLNYYREVQPTAQRNVRGSTKQHYIPVDDAQREKYTSTMDIELRRKIKIVCATRGIMFAQFIEDACKEKLKKEGLM